MIKITAIVKKNTCNAYFIVFSMTSKRKISPEGGTLVFRQ